MLMERIKKSFLDMNGVINFLLVTLFYSVNIWSKMLSDMLVNHYRKTQRKISLNGQSVNYIFYLLNFYCCCHRKHEEKMTDLLRLNFFIVVSIFNIPSFAFSFRGHDNHYYHFNNSNNITMITTVMIPLITIKMEKKSKGERESENITFYAPFLDTHTHTSNFSHLFLSLPLHPIPCPSLSTTKSYGQQTVGKIEDKERKRETKYYRFNCVWLLSRRQGITQELEDEGREGDDRR